MFKFLLGAIVLAALLPLSGCGGGEPATIKPSAVEFQKADISLEEDAKPLTVRINLSLPASKSGEVKIEIISVYPDSFVTEPETVNGVLSLPVIRGQRFITFNIIAPENTLKEGDKTISFTIISVSEGFVVGGKKALSATLIDDED